jgi:hypothetical protein
VIASGSRPASTAASRTFATVQRVIVGIGELEDEAVGLRAARAPAPWARRPAIHTSSRPSRTHGIRTSPPASGSRALGELLMTWIASSVCFSVVGGRPSTRRAESPRPIPQMVRLPNMSLSVANSDAGDRGIARRRVGDERPDHDPVGRREHLRVDDVRLLPQDVRVERPRVG